MVGVAFICCTFVAKIKYHGSYMYILLHAVANINSKQCCLLDRPASRNRL